MEQTPHPARLGHYRLLRRIGVGGMAEVFEAIRGDGTAPRVALKVLLPHMRRDEHIVTSFIDEARICAELSHPNIVAVHDFGQVGDIFYMAMEFVDGIDLRELLRRREPLGGALPVAGAAYVAHELATGLHYIHTSERRIVHRDVTPHNIFLTRDGHVKLADFGVAKARARLTHTKTGRIKGKLAYLAPEQVRGDPVSERTDVFAVGLLLYEMLTGQRANSGQTDVELLDRAMNPSCPRPSQSAAGAASLDGLVEHALARHPAMRTRDAALLADQLEAFLLQSPFGAHDLEALITQSEAHAPRANVSEAPVEGDGQGASPRRWREAATVPDSAALLSPLTALDSVITSSGERTNPRINLHNEPDTLVSPGGRPPDDALQPFGTGSLELTVPAAVVRAVREPPPPQLVPPRPRKTSRALPSAQRRTRPSSRMPAVERRGGPTGPVAVPESVDLAAAADDSAPTVDETPASRAPVQPAPDFDDDARTTVRSAEAVAAVVAVVEVGSAPTPWASSPPSLPVGQGEPTAEVHSVAASPRVPRARPYRLGWTFWLAVVLATAALAALGVVALAG